MDSVHPEETKEAADNNRLIPPFSTEATDPADVYPLHSIIPEAEWKALSITPFDAAADMKQKKAMLPYQRSNWVNEHLKTLDTSTSKNKKNLYDHFPGFSNCMLTAAQ